MYKFHPPKSDHVETLIMCHWASNQPRSQSPSKCRNSLRLQIHRSPFPLTCFTSQFLVPSSLSNCSDSASVAITGCSSLSSLRVWLPPRMARAVRVRPEVCSPRMVRGAWMRPEVYSPRKVRGVRMRPKVYSPRRVMGVRVRHEVYPPRKMRRVWMRHEVYPPRKVRRVWMRHEVCPPPPPCPRTISLERRMESGTLTWKEKTTRSGFLLDHLLSQGCGHHRHFLINCTRIPKLERCTHRKRDASGGLWHSIRGNNIL